MCVLLKVDSVYSQLGDTISPPPVNGGLFRPSSVELPGGKEDHDGNTANRMRSMSELPKVQPYKKKKIGSPPVCVVCACACYMLVGTHTCLYCHAVFHYAENSCNRKI